MNYYFHRNCRSFLTRSSAEVHQSAYQAVFLHTGKLLSAVLHLIPPSGFPEVWIMPLLIRGGEEESACPGHPGKGVQLSPNSPKTSISVKGDLSSTFQTSMYL